MKNIIFNEDIILKITVPAHLTTHTENLIKGKGDMNMYNYEVEKTPTTSIFSIPVVFNARGLETLSKIVSSI